MEVRFPKGSKTTAPLKLDGAIFDDKDWLQHYNDYWRDRKVKDLDWLNAHLLAVIEFKRGDKEIEKVFTGQARNALEGPKRCLCAGRLLRCRAAVPLPLSQWPVSTIRWG